MKLSIVVNFNPFFASSAENNRIISLIYGIGIYCDRINLIILKGYGSSIEKEKILGGFKISKVNFIYLVNHVIEKTNSKRIDYYLGPISFYIFQKNSILKHIKSDAEIVWVTPKLEPLSAMLVIRRQYPKIKIFTEINEFFDIYRYNNSTIFQLFIGIVLEWFFYGNIVKKLNGIVVMTNTLRIHFSNLVYGHLKLSHIPMTVDIDRFSSNSLELDILLRHPYILYVGAMNDAKDGVNILIDSFIKIAENFPQHSLYLIGPWNYNTPAHLQAIRNSRFSNRIEWLGEINRDSIPELLKSASLLTLARPDSKQAQGGFPTKLGEYLASGIPVCATSVGEIPDYLTDNENVFFAEPGSTDSFAEAMKKALSNPELAKKVGIAGRKVAEKHFNKDNQAKTLYDFLQSL